MTRAELRTFTTAFAQAEGTPNDTIDLFLRQAAIAFARDVGGLRGEITLTGQVGDGRSYDLPDVNQVIAGYYVDDEPEALVEGDTTNGLGLDVLRDPDFDYGSGYPQYYVLEARATGTPRVWFDAPIPAGKQVRLTVQLNAVMFGAGEDDVPGLPEPYHEALGYYASAYAARSQRDEVMARERQRQYDELIDRYQYERANKEPTGMALRDPPDFPYGGEGWDGFTNLRITSTAGGRSGTGTVSKEAVYGFLKQIARDSDSIDITVDDSAQTLTFTVAMGAALSQSERDVLEGAVQA